MSWQRYRIGALALLLASATPFQAGCGDDDNDDRDPDTGGDGDGDGDGNAAEDCDVLIASGSNTEAIQEAFIEVKTGETICFEDGTYEVDNELSLSVANVTVQGNAKDRSAVVLDYSDQQEGKDALSVSSDGFTIQHLTLKNSSGNSIVARNTKRTTFRNLRVFWDRAASTENGAYAVYPLSSEDVLVEGCEVSGASDAGIYVGQSKNIIVQDNVVHGNVAGIEIENSDNALVTDNLVYENTAGILVFVLPNLEKKDGVGAIVEDNEIRDNNLENFGEEGTTVSFVPPGIGLLLLAADKTEVRENTFRNNKSGAILAVSYDTFSLICAANGGRNCSGTDADTDPDLSKTYIHDNTFENNGQDPSALVAGLLGDSLENVLWDGIVPEGDDEDQLCLGTDPTTILVFGDNDGFLDDPITDASLFTCTLPEPFDDIDLPQDD